MQNIINNINYNNHLSIDYYTTFQLRLPLDLSIKIKIDDPVYTFNEVMNGVKLDKYLINPNKDPRGRKGYNSVKLLKVILFGFMLEGYASLRKLENLCNNDIRFMWLLEGDDAPSHMTFSNFINDYLTDSIENIFREINYYIIKKDNVDLDHIYLDGTKLEANANKYSWVWKKASLTNRNKLYLKITKLIKEINETDLILDTVCFSVYDEYDIDYMEFIFNSYASKFNINVDTFTHGKGQKKALYQRNYELLYEYKEKLKDYAIQINKCGDIRNSYSKTDVDATFMRIKTDYMGNDQLLPSYNMQIIVADEYILTGDVYQFASDTDCFVPIINKFKDLYGKYPKYPVADAGYGSYNNYIFCEKNNMEKYMKFPMYKKTVTDKKYREDPFKVINFNKDKDEDLICPKGRKFKFLKTIPVKNNMYGRTSEQYQCVSCKRCNLKSQCHKSKGNRIVNLNEELTIIHKEVLSNLESTQGALLRMNRSIQVEGAFGVMKEDYTYRQIRRRGLENVKLEFLLVSISFNIRKYHNKKKRTLVS